MKPLKRIFSFFFDCSSTSTDKNERRRELDDELWIYGVSFLVALMILLVAAILDAL